MLVLLHGTWCLRDHPGAGSQVAPGGGPCRAISGGRSTPYKGEESLWVRCSWRLEYKNAVVASWGDYLAGRKSRKDNCFGPVFGKRVTRARLTSQVGDLRVDFANGYTLRVFADVSVQGSEEFNWQLYRSNGQPRFGIGPGGVWMTEQTEQQGAEQLRTV